MKKTNKNLTIKQIITVTSGVLITGTEENECINYSKDTRTILKGDTYIGIKGEQFDGNIFWKEAIKNGAKTVIVQDIDFKKEDLEKYSNINIIKVEDTIDALQKIAKLKRSLYNIPVIAITGSVGKTTTKDIIASVISRKYKTLKTEGNYNNNIGLPFTILKLKDEEVLILEMGMNHLGEIELLSNIAKPTISVIINIGTSHIGNLGSRQNILKAKLEILNGMDEKNLIINNDNDILASWNKTINKNYIKTYGIDNKSNKIAENIVITEENTIFETEILGKKEKVQMPLTGKHFIYNSLSAIMIGEYLELSKEEILDGLKTISITKNRLDIFNIGDNIKLINDAYNASFESMKASIEVVSNYKEYVKICVLGDMFELGEFSEEIHRKVGKYLSEKNIDKLLCCGNNSKYIIDEAIKNGILQENTYFTEDKEKLTEKLKEITQSINKKYILMFKASNGMKFYKLADEFKIYLENGGK